MSVSGKSIRFSIYAMILTVVVLVACIFLLKWHFLMVLPGVVLLIFPAMLQRKALTEASGTFDKIFAKFVVPIFAAAALLAVIFSVAFWM